VLTFRNVHNLVMDLYDEGAHTGLAFQATYDVLRPAAFAGSRRKGSGALSGDRGK
jgi:hypothetical protein